MWQNVILCSTAFLAIKYQIPQTLKKKKNKNNLKDAHGYFIFILCQTQNRKKYHEGCRGVQESLCNGSTGAESRREKEGCEVRVRSYEQQKAREQMCAAFGETLSDDLIFLGTLAWSGIKLQHWSLTWQCWHKEAQLSITHAEKKVSNARITTKKQPPLTVSIGKITLKEHQPEPRVCRKAAAEARQHPLVPVDKMTGWSG